MPRKIDYYPGAHGNFLDLLIVLSSSPSLINLNECLFESNGACHAKFRKLLHPNYPLLFGCEHYSFLQPQQLDPNDQVVEIHVPENHLITLIVNEQLRAGKDSLDVDNPEIDTLCKYQGVLKAQSWLIWLIEEFGHRKNYPRAALRQMYFSRYRDTRNQFEHKGEKIVFPYEAFFDFRRLCDEIKTVCHFFKLPFTLHDETERIWKEFIKRNQGLERFNRCEFVLREVQQGKTVDISMLGVAEEAWILYRLFKDLVDPQKIIANWPDSVLARG